MLETLAGMVTAVKDVIEKTFSQVYSVLWDDGQDQSANWDPALAKKIVDCRSLVLPDVLALRGKIDYAMALLGIERDDLDLDVVGVESWEQRIEKKMKEARENDMIVELLDSDDDEDCSDNRKLPAVTGLATKVKSESVRI